MQKLFITILHSFIRHKKEKESFGLPQLKKTKEKYMQSTGRIKLKREKNKKSTYIIPSLSLCQPLIHANDC